MATKGGGEELLNYKGMYFNDDTGNKNIDPTTGAHFLWKDMCMRLNKVKSTRDEYMQQITQLSKKQSKHAPAPAAGDETDDEKKNRLKQEKDDFIKKLGSVVNKPQKDAEPKLHKPTIRAISNVQPMTTEVPKKKLFITEGPAETKTTEAWVAKNEKAQVIKTRQSIQQQKSQQNKAGSEVIDHRRIQENSAEKMSTAQKSVLNLDNPSSSSLARLQNDNTSSTETLTKVQTGVAQPRRSSKNNARVQQIYRKMQEHGNSKPNVGQQEIIDPVEVLTLNNQSILTTHQKRQLVLLEQQQRSKSNEGNGMDNGNFSGVVGVTSQTFQNQPKKVGPQKKQNNRQTTGDTVILKTTGEVVVDHFGHQKSPLLGQVHMSAQHQQLNEAIMRSDSNKGRRQGDELIVQKNGRRQNTTGISHPTNTGLGRGGGSVYLHQAQDNDTGSFNGNIVHSNSSMRQQQKTNNLVGPQDPTGLHIGLANGNSQSQSYQQSLSSNRKIRTRSSQRSNRAIVGPGKITEINTKGQRVVHTQNDIQKQAGMPMHHMAIHQQNIQYMNNPNQQQPVASRNRGLETKPVVSKTFYGQHQISFKSSKSNGDQGPMKQSSIVHQSQKAKGLVNRGAFQGIPANQLQTQQQQPAKSRNGPIGTATQLRMVNSVGLTHGSDSNSVGSNLSAGMQQLGSQGYSIVQQNQQQVGQRVKVLNKGGGVHAVPVSYQNNQQPGVKPRGNSTGSQNQKDNQHLYRMIVPNKQRGQKNIASSYLRGIENQLMSGGANGTQINQQQMVGQNRQQMLQGVQVQGGSSRNNQIVAPVGTQKTRSIGAGSNNAQKLLQGQSEFRKSYY